MWAWGTRRPWLGYLSKRCTHDQHPKNSSPTAQVYKNNSASLYRQQVEVAFPSNTERHQLCPTYCQFAIIVPRPSHSQCANLPLLHTHCGLFASSVFELGKFNSCDVRIYCVSTHLPSTLTEPVTPSCRISRIKCTFPGCIVTSDKSIHRKGGRNSIDVARGSLKGGMMYPSHCAVPLRDCEHRPDAQTLKAVNHAALQHARVHSVDPRLRSRRPYRGPLSTVASELFRK